MKNSWIKAWAVVGHFVWAIMTPLLVFIGGGGWLIRRYDWDTRIILVFVALGLIFAGLGLRSYVRQLFAVYEDLQKTPPPQDKKDYDY